MNSRVPGINSSNSIPILIGTSKGNYELLLSFVGAKNIDDFPPNMHDFVAELDGSWVVPAIVGAREILGPLQDNIPAGEGGIPISLSFAQELASAVDIPEFLAEFRNRIDDDCQTARAIDAFLKKYRGF
jgi:hypothetical protein